MGKKNRRLRQKVKKRKREKIDRARQPVSLAYHGKKYRTRELVKVMFQTEAGIYESFVITDRRLTDHAVRTALETLIAQMRKGVLPPFEGTEDVAQFEGDCDADLVIWNIRRNWQHLFQTEPHPGRDRLIGVLRTILGSIEVRGSISPTSRGYLRYIEGFLTKLGLSVDACSSEAEMQRAVGEMTDAIHADRLLH